MTAPCMVSEGTVIEDFTNYASWSSDSQIGTLAKHWRCLDDPSKPGTMAYKKYTASPSAGYIWRTDKSFSLSDMTTLRLDLSSIVDADVFLYGCKISIELSSVTDFSKSKYIGPLYGNTTQSICWYLGTGIDGGQRITIHKDEFLTYNSESWSNTFVAIRIGFHPVTAAYGWSGYQKVYFDKLVKNPVVDKPYLLLSIDPSFTTDTNIMMDALSDNGLTAKAFANMVDTDNIGDANYNTWAQLKAIYQQGVQMPANHTGWILQTPYNAVRPVPPYPAEDTDFANCTDSTNAEMLTAEMHHEIMARLRTIYIYYGLPWDDSVLAPHAGNFNSVEGRRFFDEYGFRALLARSDYNTISYPNAGHFSMSMPITGRTIWGTYVTDSQNAQGDIQAAIDKMIVTGRYLCLYYGLHQTSGEWDESWLRSDLAYIKSKWDAGQIEVVTLAEFLARGMPTVSTASSSDIILGAINLNDQSHYFVGSEGLNLGNMRTEWDEIGTYAGLVNAQANVRRGGLIPITIPMRVTGTSLSNLNTLLNALWSEVDQPINTLQVGSSEFYDIVYSSRPESIERDPFYQLGYTARFTLTLMRKP